MEKVDARRKGAREVNEVGTESDISAAKADTVCHPMLCFCLSVSVSLFLSEMDCYYFQYFYFLIPSKAPKNNNGHRACDRHVTLQCFITFVFVCSVPNFSSQ
ncbi:hypothetical protein PHAVU_005G057700 [Phaseolus vulgaris]|uniref:Uncharacterized protein n=1 Tax=Phaseolus vulgaris TaxID=3885 RepID=V7BXI2_PHAVU|nr:hypothetical protein PHAVU_005G057700g [Phaseolus vulgaris]ESW21281.1 hypothetical protein PHAVU_005G057700g [Phaseolus vulgaris]